MSRGSAGAASAAQSSSVSIGACVPDVQRKNDVFFTYIFSAACQNWVADVTQQIWQHLPLSRVGREKLCSWNLCFGNQLKGSRTRLRVTCWQPVLVLVGVLCSLSVPRDVWVAFPCLPRVKLLSPGFPAGETARGHSWDSSRTPRLLSHVLRCLSLGWNRVQWVKGIPPLEETARA